MLAMKSALNELAAGRHPGDEKRLPFAELYAELALKSTINGKTVSVKLMEDDGTMECLEFFWASLLESLPLLDSVCTSGIF